MKGRKRAASGGLLNQDDVWGVDGNIELPHAPGMEAPVKGSLASRSTAALFLASPLMSGIERDSHYAARVAGAPRDCSRPARVDSGRVIIVDRRPAGSRG